MKRSSLAALGLVLLFSASSAFAKTPGRGVYDIPFPFMVGGKVLPAGKYRVKSIGTESNTLWLIQRTDGGAKAVTMTDTAEPNTEGPGERLVFRNYDGQNYLSQIYVNGGRTGRQLPESRSERESAKKAGGRDTVAVAAGRE